MSISKNKITCEILKKIMWIGLIIFVIVSENGLISQANTDSNVHNSTILIVLDGVQRNHLNEMINNGKLNNITDISKTGSYNKVIITDHWTSTDPGTAEILTGYNPETMDYDNNSVLNYKTIPDGLTIFEVLNESGFYTGLIAGRNHTLPPGIYQGEPYRGSSFPDKQFEYAKPEINYWYSPGPVWSDGDSLPMADGSQTNSDILTNKAINFINFYANSKFFLYVHMTEPDLYGHKFGENSPVYNASLNFDDLQVGKIVEELKELNIYNSTFLIVTTDHGFLEGGTNHNTLPFPNGDPDTYNIWMVNNRIGFNDSIVFDQKDIALMIYRALGVI